MSFGLKNVGATYQYLVNIIFSKQIGKTMEVYIDDMFVKGKVAKDHEQYTAEMFEILRKYKMKLNSIKCDFRVDSRKFVGYMVNQKGIEANLEKIRVIIEMRAPIFPKEVQSIIGSRALLNHFISKSKDRCRPFFEMLQRRTKFKWTPDYQNSFEELKKTISSTIGHLQTQCRR